MEGNTVIKLFVFVAVVVAAVLLVKSYQQKRQDVVDEIAEAITANAQLMEQPGGGDLNSLATNLAVIKGAEWELVEDALANTGGGQASFASAELVLRRIYDLPQGTLTPSAIERSGHPDGAWPWVIEGESAKLEPFELKSQTAVGGVDGMMRSFDEQGKRRPPWR